MEFDASVCTKEFLQEHRYFLGTLCSGSEEFALSSLASDIDILKLIINEDFRIPAAHSLACNQAKWVELALASNLDIFELRDDAGNTTAHAIVQNNDTSLIAKVIQKHPSVLLLANRHGETVAHQIAKKPRDIDWINSELLKDRDVLRLENKSGLTVAHYLAFYSPCWANSKDAQDPDVLMLGMGKTMPLAVALIDQVGCLENQTFLSKQILCLDWDDQSIAERLYIKYNNETGMSLPWIAIHLISQGAAFKYSEVMSTDIVRKILKQGQSLINDSLEPEIGLKRSIAMYSTVIYAFERVQLNFRPKDYADWVDLVNEASNSVNSILEKNPELLHENHCLDFNCEPGMLLIQQALSKKEFKSAIESFNVDEIDTTSTHSLY
jgi:hypothetical protein